MFIRVTNHSIMGKILSEHAPQQIKRIIDELFPLCASRLYVMNVLAHTINVIVEKNENKVNRQVLKDLLLDC